MIQPATDLFEAYRDVLKLSARRRKYAGRVRPWGCRMAARAVLARHGISSWRHEFDLSISHHRVSVTPVEVAPFVDEFKVELEKPEYRFEKSPKELGL